MAPFPSSIRALAWAGRFGGVIPALACIARLYHEVAPVAIEGRPVQHVVMSVVEVDRVPVSHEPVLVVADEQVGVRFPEDGAGNALPAQTDSINSR